jgi:hypothetical protein
MDSDHDDDWFSLLPYYQPNDLLPCSVSTENIPILGAEEKYNEAVFSSVKRIIAKINNEVGQRFTEHRFILY